MQAFAHGFVSAAFLREPGPDGRLLLMFGIPNGQLGIGEGTNVAILLILVVDSISQLANIDFLIGSPALLGDLDVGKKVFPAVADLNADGIPDILVGSDTSQLRWFLSRPISEMQSCGSCTISLSGLIGTGTQCEHREFLKLYD